MSQRTRITMTADGPLIVHGPVDLILPDGTAVIPQRRTFALCLCNRSQAWPFCDTSHRKRRVGQKQIGRYAVEMSDSHHCLPPDAPERLQRWPRAKPLEADHHTCFACLATNASEAECPPPVRLTPP
jgi:CDGSH-type Zn-finger protein